MNVKVAKSAGFCWGVKRAIDMALELRRKTDASIHTLGPLIHNPQTLEMLRSKRIHEVSQVDDAVAVNSNAEVLGENPKDGYVLVRAHGIAPEVRKKLKQSSLQMIDATCPDVGLIHGLVRKHVNRGYEILILGDPKHAEVMGIMGYTEGRGHVLESPDQVAQLPPLEKVYVVAQSTLDGETWLHITEAIKKRWPETVIRNTICDPTTDRQTEVKTLCEEVDALVVVGGRNSANTKHLVQIAEKTGIPTFHVESDEEILEEWFRSCHTVGVTAGASTPNWLIMKVVERIEGIKEVTERSLKDRGIDFLEFLIQNHILLALGAMALSYIVNHMMDFYPGPQRFWTMMMAGLFVYSMHSFHGSRELGTFTLKDLVQIDFFRHRRGFIFFRSGISFFLGLAISAHLGSAIFFFYLFVSVIGFGYRLEILPTKRFKFLKYGSLLAIPGSRDIFVAFAWATMIVGAPAFYLSSESSQSLWQVLKTGGLPLVSAFIFVGIMVFVRSLVGDERDIKRDKLVGRETLPIVLGPEKTIRLQWLSLLLLAFILIYLGFVAPGKPLALVLLPAVIFTYVYVHLYHFRVKYRSLFLDFMADSKFLAIGIWTYAWLHWFR